MYLIMLGAQGTGKGTVAGLLSNATNWPQISTGDIFRKNIKEKTPLGIKANEYIAVDDKEFLDKYQKLVDALEDLDDITNVYSNLE